MFNKTQVSRNHWLTGLLIFLPITGMGVLIAAFSPSYFEAEGKIAVQSSVQHLDGQNEIQTNPPSDAEKAGLSTEVEFFTSSDVINRALQAVQRQAPLKNKSRGELLQSLEIVPNDFTQTMTVTYRDRVDIHASLIVNALMTSYQTQRQEATQARLNLALKKLQEERLPQAQKTRQNAENALREFQQKHALQDNSKPTATIAVRLEQTQQGLNQIRAQNQQLNLVRQKLITELGLSSNNAAVLVSASQSREFQRKFEQLRQVEEELSDARNDYTELHPQIVELKRNKTSLREQLTAEVKRVTGQAAFNLDSILSDRSKQIATNELIALENQQKALDNQFKQLQATQASLRQKSKVLPAIVAQHQQLLGNVALNKTRYNALQQQQQRLESERNESSQQIRILSSATVPLQKISPYRQPILWSALGLGLIMGSITGWISYKRDRQLTTTTAIKKHLSLKVLGSIPTFEPAQQDLLYDGDLQRVIPTLYPIHRPGGPISESFRMLYLNLKVLPEFKTLSTLAITSAVPQEGKSSTIANLAAVIAQSGRRVLIVDANLRYPFQDLIWNLPNHEGLSNILMSQTSLLISIRPITPNLDILTSGSIRKLAKNPFESQQMKLLVIDLASRYDLVLFDLPPVNASADAAIISQLTDGVILVARPGYEDEMNATKALTVLNNLNSKVFGMVLNDIKDPKETFMPLNTNLQADGEAEPDEFDDMVNEWPPSTLRPQLNQGEAIAPISSELSARASMREPFFDAPDRPTPSAKIPAITPFIRPSDISISDISLQDLENELEDLQAKWFESKLLIAQKEEELIHICQAKQELQIKLEGVSQSQEISPKQIIDLETLQRQIQNTEERKQHLIEHLQSLRVRFKAQQELFYAHLELLQTRHDRDVQKSDVE